MSSPRPRILLAFHWYLESLHEGALRRCMELGYEAEVLNADTAEGLRGKPFAGIVAMQAHDPNHPVRRFTADTEKPVVELSLAFPENSRWGRYPEDCEKIATSAAERLRRLPVSTFLFVAGGPWWNHDARWSVFNRELKNDARPRVRFDAGGLDEAAQDRMREYLLTLKRPIAVFGSVDSWAKLALDAALDAGMKVPGDLYALGFGDRELVSRMAAIPISTIGIDYKTWARNAVDLLDDLIKGRATPGEIRRFPPREIIERATTAGETGGDPLCERAIALMRERTRNPADVSDIAKHLGVSKATLERAFTKALGCGVAHKFLEVRIDAAKALLASGAKAESVAKEVGFNSYRGFMKAFTRITGEKPGTLSKSSRRGGA